MVTVRHATKRWGVWLLVALGAACGGNAFHVDRDPAPVGNAGEPSSAGGSAGESTAAGAQAGGGASGEGGGGSPGNEGGSSGEAGAASSGGGEAGSGSPPATPPLSREQLVYWFDAAAGVTEADGRVVEWADQSGNARHAFQRLPSQQPKLARTDLLPYPVVELNGETHLQLPEIDAPIDGGLTLFAVAGRSADFSCAALLELSNGPEVDDVHFGMSGGGTMHFEVADIWFDPDAPVFDLNALRQATYKQSGDATGAIAELSANGAFIDSHPVPFPERKPRRQNFIGFSLYENCGKFIGGIGEIILYSRVLSGEEQRKVEQYLHDKWQLAR